ncbi:hypothetical protein [Mongoliimonas terrestris]|uniref:hypothetical protein n=1 Tax=Mongoliimonas terrestris TaxID=1709001 RepID=UPI00111515EA
MVVSAGGVVTAGGVVVSAGGVVVAGGAVVSTGGVVVSAGGAVVSVAPLSSAGVDSGSDPLNPKMKTIARITAITSATMIVVLRDRGRAVPRGSLGPVSMVMGAPPEVMS